MSQVDSGNTLHEIRWYSEVHSSERGCICMSSDRAPACLSESCDALRAHRLSSPLGFAQELGYFTEIVFTDLNSGPRLHIDAG